MSNPIAARVVALSAILAMAGCAPDSPTGPPDAQSVVARNAGGPTPAVQSEPSGERVFGKVTVEPAYNAETGALLYLLTPEKAPFPSKANGHAISPLYLVEYPAGSSVVASGRLNCEGVPGNCPDHDGAVASVATSVMPGVYGTDPTLVPGHDHVVDPPGGADWNVAWEVVEVLFTNSAAANEHLTTDAQIDAAVARGDAIKVDLGFAFNCSVVPASLYWRGTPVL
jgi:hypothetical protein